MASDFANCALMLALASPSSHRMLIPVLPFFMGLFKGTSTSPSTPRRRGFSTRVPPPDERHSGIHGRDRDGGGRHPAGVLYDLVPVNSIFFIDGVFLLSAGIPGPGRKPSGNAPPPPAGPNVRRPWPRAILAMVGALFAARFIEAFGRPPKTSAFRHLRRLRSGQRGVSGRLDHGLLGLGKFAAVVFTPAAVGVLRRRVEEPSMFIGFLVVTFALFLGVFLSDALWTILGFALLPACATPRPKRSTTRSCNILRRPRRTN